LTPAQIFGHLDPLDVLHLTRTTKALRDILMRRSALSVWKHALSNVEGLPDCPRDLTEPQWVNLVFDTLCHVCVEPIVLITLPHLSLLVLLEDEHLEHCLDESHKVLQEVQRREVCL
jgi:hypothetical protein